MSATILFLCDRNTIRSPMAAVLCNHLAGGAAHAESAGITPGEADPLSEAALDEIGLSLPDAPRGVEAVKLGRFDLIVALSPQAQHRALELTRNTGTAVEYWPVQDPSVVDGSREQRLAAYRLLRDELLKKLKDRFKSAT